MVIKGGLTMTENKMDDISRIKDITLKIAFHENRIAMHKSAIERLRKEKSILMMNGEWIKNGRKQNGAGSPNVR
jgi:hypothetical protein